MHKDYAERIGGFVSALEDTGYKIKDIGGWRPGDSKEHGKARAIDINPVDNPDSYPGQKNWRQTNLPDAITKDLLHKKFGLGWGGIPHGKNSGDWGKHRSDTMHFSAANHEGGMDTQRWAAYQAKQKKDIEVAQNQTKAPETANVNKTVDNIPIQPKDNPLKPNLPSQTASVPSSQPKPETTTSSNEITHDYGSGGKTTIVPDTPSKAGYKLYQTANLKEAKQAALKILREELEVIDISNEPGHIPSKGKMGKIQGAIFHHSAGRGDMKGLVATGHQRYFAAQYGITRADPAKGIPAKIYRYGPERQLHTQTSRGVGPAPAGLGNDNTEGVEIIALNQKDVQPEQKALAAKFAVWHQRKHGYDPQKGIFGHSDTDYGHRDDEGSSNAKDIRDNWDKHNDDYDREFKLGKYASTQIAKSTDNVPIQPKDNPLDPKGPSGGPAPKQSSTGVDSIPQAPNMPTKDATKVPTEPQQQKQPEAPSTATTTQTYDYKLGDKVIGRTTVVPNQYKLFQSPGAIGESFSNRLKKKALGAKTSNAKVLQKNLASAKTEITQLKRKLKKCEPMDEASEVQRMNPKDAEMMGFGEPSSGSKTFTYTYPKEKGESVRDKINRFKQQDKDAQEFQKTVKQKGLQLPEQLSGFLAHVPRQYLDKFPDVKQHTDQAAQYYRERTRKAETARHYHPKEYITGKKEESEKPKG